MIGVDRIDDVRRLGRSGASVASIARDTGVPEPAVRQCLRELDLSERPPVVGRAPGSPLLEPFAGLVDPWPLEDRRRRFKRRHAARRVFDRLAERGFGGSYATVRRYVGRRGASSSRPSSTPGRRRGSRCSTGSPASARWTSGRRTSACAASPRGGWRWPHSLVRPARVCPCGMGPRGVLLGR